MCPIINEFEKNIQKKELQCYVLHLKKKILHK